MAANERRVCLAIDASDQAEMAFNCKYNLIYSHLHSLNSMSIHYPASLQINFRCRKSWAHPSRDFPL